MTAVKSLFNELGTYISENRLLQLTWDVDCIEMGLLMKNKRIITTLKKDIGANQGV